MLVEPTTNIAFRNVADDNCPYFCLWYEALFVFYGGVGVDEKNSMHFQCFLIFEFVLPIFIEWNEAL